ncbi:MAG TPA: alpha/beta hydrolase [Phycisphaerae bacterium]|nr:alpha/beta hydrolase [Phycisphaerae bacterium]
MRCETAGSDKTTRGRRGWRRVVYRLVGVVVVAYVAACVFLYVGQARFVYFPSREYGLAPGDIGLAYEDLTLPTSDGLSIAGWYVPHTEAAGSILFCHGNAGNMSDRMVTIQTLHALGYNVLMFDYRGYGRSEGSPDEAGTYVDAEAAWRYLTQTRGESPRRVVLMGRSLGGAVAIELASRHEAAALVVESTFTRLADVGRVHYRWVPVGVLTRYRYDSAARVATISCPKLFLHGRDDRLVPIALGRRLYEAAAAPKRFIETPGGHNSGGFTYSEEYTAELGAFLHDALETGRSEAPTSE